MSSSPVTMKTKPLVVAIVGEAGVGKDMAASWLEEHECYNRIVSYTTRPIREGEKQMREHLFVGEFPYMDDMVCHTEYGGYHYWVCESQILPHPVSVYVVDEVGLQQLKARRDGEDERPWNVFSVLIKRDREKRLEAGVAEERMQRDSGRTPLPEKCYDMVIANNKSLKAFEYKLRDLVQAIKEML